MVEEMNELEKDMQSAQSTKLQSIEKKIVLPKDVQIRMMKFFLKTSIPTKKREELEKARLSISNDRSDE